MNHSFDIGIASKYSDRIAIFLNHIAFWTQRNIANNNHCYEGFFWTYNSLEAFGEIFPYWGIQTIRTVINACLKEKLIIKNNFNVKKYDKTVWYALSLDGLKLFPTILEQYNTAMLKLTNEAQQGFQDVEAATTQAQSHLLESTNAFVEINIPIPDIFLQIKKNYIYVHFSDFWNLYPKKVAKKKCQEEWALQNLDLIAPKIMEKLRMQVEQDNHWLKGYSPLPLKYLQEERWDDDINKSPEMIQVELKEKEKIKKELECKKREAEQERLTQQRREHEFNKHDQYNQDGMTFRSISREVSKSSPPKEFKNLRKLLGG